MVPLPNLVLALAGAAGAIGLATLAAVLLARGAEQRDISVRLSAVIRPVAPLPQGEAVSVKLRLFAPLLRLGEALRDSALISQSEREEFQRVVAAAGFHPRHAVPGLIGAKAVLTVLLPLAALIAIFVIPLDFVQGGFAFAMALMLAVMGPNWVMGRMRAPFQKQLRRGLPDALDLMVVTAEAGLGLEGALERVAREMERSNRAIALELNILVQELRMLPDRRVALDRLGERTGLDGFKQLAGTLSQTLRYGTPLTQALRVLATEMRAERQLRLEEKAVRLPALLIGPLILFILPALFIALIGPSILEMGKTFGGP